MTIKLKETAKGSAGLPVGIQVIGLPFEDEKVLGFMKML
jgi:Asp-tRNA(Asn)/Glu-tRNA(Gln) amidotransferase A subunit family amidase